MSVRMAPILVAALALLTACGPRKTAPAPVTRDFPRAEVPKLITEPYERAVWVCEHYWDAFTAPDSFYYSDSLTVNGVPLEELEKQVGTYATLLQQVPLEDGVRAMTAFCNRLDAFQSAHPDANLFPQTVALVSRYFYDPNSPVRSEDLYLPFVRRLAASDHIDPALRGAYAWDSEMCALNRTGTPAADFTFIDTAGRLRSLYSLKAEWTLLIFGNPDCHACTELQEQMDDSPVIPALIAEGRLQVVDIYIDEDIDLWKSRRDSYPATWLNGYDPAFVIRTDRIYNVRALPSLYLLDADKTVLLKDALPDQVIWRLSN